MASDNRSKLTLIAPDFAALSWPALVVARCCQFSIIWRHQTVKAAIFVAVYVKE